MTRTLSLLALAAVAFLVIGVVAAILKFTAGLALFAVGFAAILVAAVWMLVRSLGAQASGERA